MIVVSGVLVFVALIFLVIGLAGEGLLMIWLSIGTSVVAGVFLLLGALQRRGAPAPAADSGQAGTDMLERVTAVSVRPKEEPAADVVEEAAPASAGQVAVVPGRPRYHVEGCRFLAGRPDVETVDVEQARSDGYTACGVCKPDAALEAAATSPEPEPEPEEIVEEPVAEEPAEEAAPAPAKRTAAKKTAAAATKPAKKTAAAAKATAAKPAATKATAAKPAGSQVVVIPDRGKFHTETCRFVKDVPGTVTLTKATAKRQGYAPCGVCKP